MAEERQIKEDEIDLIELAKTIWAGRKFIAKVTSAFIVIGLVIAFTSPVSFVASCKLLPESQNSQMSTLGGLAGLAGLAGVNLKGMSASHTDVLTPLLYPEIVYSLPFMLEILHDTIFYEEKNIYTTPYTYITEIARPSWISYVKKYTVGLPALLKNSIGGSTKPIPQKTSEYYRFSKADWSLIQSFKNRITIDIDDLTGIIAITVEMPDSYAAAELTARVEDMITKAVIRYKTEKATESLNFVREIHDEAKLEFEMLQIKLARASDRNRNIVSATGEIGLKRIQDEYNVAYDVYKGLVSQVKQAEIKLREETPVFTVLEPVRIPSDKSKPKKKVIIVLFFIGGMIISTGYVLIKSILFKNA